MEKQQSRTKIFNIKIIMQFKERLKNLMNKLFPGKTLEERMSNEYTELVKTGEFRKEFFVMGLYSILLVVVVVLSNLYGFFEEFSSVVYVLLFCLGAYFVISDFFKRKKLFNKKIVFYVDCVFFTGFMMAIIFLTGDHQSPIRFPLLFLTAISVPLYATLLETIIYLLLLVFSIVTIHFYLHGWHPIIIFDILGGGSFLAAASVIKITINELNKKAHDLKIVSDREQKLASEVRQHNSQLNEVVREKTDNLSKLLAQAEQKSGEVEQQRVAMLNIMDDMSETQDNLQKSKSDLEERQKEMTSLVGLTQGLTGISSAEKAISVLHHQLSEIVDVMGVVYFVSLGDQQHIFRAHLNSSISKSQLTNLKTDLHNHLLHINGHKLDVGVIHDSMPHTTGAQLKEKSVLKFVPKMFELVSAGVIFGSVMVIFSEKQFRAHAKKLDFISALISTFSVSVSGLQSIIKMQESKTESLVYSLSSGVIMIDKKMNIVLVNPAAQYFTSLKKDEININRLNSWFASKELSKMLDAVVNKNRAVSVQEVRKDTKSYSVTFTPVVNNEKKIEGVAIIIHDITEAKKIEQMKDEFVSVASHQLRTPLTAIKLFTEMLKNEQVGKLNKEQRENLSHVYQSTNRMARLVNDLLNVTRIESGRLNIVPEKTDFNHFVDTIISEAEPLASAKASKIVFNRTLADDFTISIDKNLIRQVIHNLVVNAIRYAPETGGKIIINTKKKSDNLLVSIEDNGIGIPKMEQGKIFAKFFRAENAVKVATEGTGLGLYVSKMIVAQSGGKIWFESKEGVGAKFHFTLPLGGMEKKRGAKGLAIS